MVILNQIMQKSNSILKLILFVLAYLSLSNSFAQDPLFSQYYAAPMYLNPALTGSSNVPRFTLNYRNQWPGLSANYITTNFTADMYSQKINSGFGFMFTQDNQYADLSTTMVGGTYSYNQQITEEYSVRMGVQASIVNRGVRSPWDRFTFGDQIAANGSISGVTLDPLVGTPLQVKYVDFSTGAIAYSDKAWAGVTFKHINRPKYGLDNTTKTAKDVKLPMFFSLHTGYKMELPENILNWTNSNTRSEDIERSLSPSLVYERRGPYQRLDVGCYVTSSPVILGVWYRGLPIFGQDKAGATRNVALAGMLGYRQDNVTIGYSYDLNLLPNVRGTGGAHEISISYLLDIQKDKKPKRKKKKEAEIPCPKL